MVSAPAITFPAKEPILFGSDLHFLPLLTGTETYWARLSAPCKVNLNVLSTIVWEVSVPEPVIGACYVVLIFTLYSIDLLFFMILPPTFAVWHVTS